MKTTTLTNTVAGPLIALAFATLSCADDDGGDGSLSIVVEPEDVVQEGLMPGDSGEGVRDGWAVTFHRYLVAVGDIRLEFATDHAVTAAAASTHVLDLATIPAAGLPIAELSRLRAGRWEFHYRTPGADGAQRDDSVTEADFDEMVENDLTYLIDGTLAKSDGRSCPPSAHASPPAGAVSAGTNTGGDACFENPGIGFLLGVAAPTAFGPCEVDGASGVVVPTGGTQTAAITIHGDHLFFNGFPTGEEGGTMRLAQWLADCDLDVDGTVTRDELEQILPADLPELDARFQLGSAPIEDLAGQSMWIYVTAQLKTQGHLQGEGECPIDGDAHEH